MQVDFYHLAASPVERVLPRIAERVLTQGGRLLIVCADDALAARIDICLWDYRADAFLPHGRAEGEGDALQPVLIAPAITAANAARHIALADGRWRDEALGYDRAFHLFDDAAIDAARMAWRGLAGRERITRNFWKQDDGGKWIQAA